MPALSESEIAALLRPYVEGVSVAHVDPSLYERLSVYLELLLKWNVRTNLTAIRQPEAIVARHFGESLFAGWVLSRYLQTGTVLDVGSGAGFPGVPMQLVLPGARITLVESQGKKAAFLREVVRALELPAEVWAGRAEALGRKFDVVTMRAVDRMAFMERIGWTCLHPGGLFVRLTTRPAEAGDRVLVPDTREVFVEVRREGDAVERSQSASVS